MIGVIPFEKKCKPNEVGQLHEPGGEQTSHADDIQSVSLTNNVSLHNPDGHAVVVVENVAE